jgi:hypothetical protein
MGNKPTAPTAHSLSAALRDRARSHPYPLRAELEAVAAELDRLARFQDRVQFLVIRATEAPTVAEISDALEELQAWAHGQAPLRDGSER